MKKYRSRKPFYDSDLDFTTNAPSYYEALARFTKSLKNLTYRVNDVEQRFKDLVLEWLEDGTLTGLLEQVLLDDYATKKFVEKAIEDLNIDDYAKIEYVDSQINIFVDEIRNDLETLKDLIYNDFDEFKDYINNELDERLSKKLDLDGFYNEHSVSYYRDNVSETSYQLMKIPKYDKDGNIIKIKVTDDRDTTDFLKVTEFSHLKNATAMINASATSGSNLSGTRTTIMNDGDIRRTDNNMKIYNYIIAWDNENRMKSFPPNTPAQELKDAGYITAIPAFMPLIENGQDVTHSTPLESLGNATDPHPRTAIAQDVNGNTYFFTCNGRLIGEYGMTTKDVVRVLLDHCMTWAHMLDGGGSTTMVNYGQVINRMSGAVTGDRGGTEREVANAIYIGKDNVNDTARNLLYYIGEGTKSIHRHNQYLEALRYQKNNYISLVDYFINGWQPHTHSGQNTPRAWILPNNTLYLRGVVVGGEQSDTENTTFMQLPEQIPPMFETHHLVAGDNRGEIYKIVVTQEGTLKWYFWNENFTSSTLEGDIYIRLDGIFIPLNYTSSDDHLNRKQGIQLGWIPYPLERDK